jgi:hypothetical protein
MATGENRVRAEANETDFEFGRRADARARTFFR